MHLEPNDPIIDEIREVRHRISERFGHDPARLVAYYIQLQQQYQGRLIEAPEADRAETLSEGELGPGGDCVGLGAQDRETSR